MIIRVIIRRDLGGETRAPSKLHSVRLPRPGFGPLRVGRTVGAESSSDARECGHDWRRRLPARLGLTDSSMSFRPYSRIDRSVSPPSPSLLAPRRFRSAWGAPASLLRPQASRPSQCMGFWRCGLRSCQRPSTDLSASGAHRFTAANSAIRCPSFSKQMSVYWCALPCFLLSERRGLRTYAGMKVRGTRL